MSVKDLEGSRDQNKVEELLLYMGILLYDEDMCDLLLVRNVKLPLPVLVFLSVSSKQH